MIFIKNKTKHKTKILLASSRLLLLSTSQGGCWMLRSTSLYPSKVIKQISKENKITKPDPKEPCNSSTNKKKQNKKDIDNYESGYESDSQESSDIRSGFYTELSNNIGIDKSVTIPDASPKSKDYAIYEVRKSNTTSSDPGLSHDLQHTTTTDILKTEQRHNKVEQGVEKSSMDHNQPIKNVPKPDNFNDLSTSNNYENTVIHSDQGYGSINSLLSEDIKESSDEEPVYRELIFIKNNHLPAHIHDDAQLQSDDKIDDPIHSKIIQKTNPIERTKLIDLITDDLITLASRVHKNLSIKCIDLHLNLIDELSKTQKIINEMVVLRRGDDNLLTEEQKSKLINIKTKIKAPDSPFDRAINLYKEIDTIDLPKEAIKLYNKKSKRLKKEIKLISQETIALRKTILYTDL